MDIFYSLWTACCVLCRTYAGNRKNVHKLTEFMYPNNTTCSCTRSRLLYLVFRAFDEDGKRRRKSVPVHSFLFLRSYVRLFVDRLSENARKTSPTNGLFALIEFLLINTSIGAIFSRQSLKKTRMDLSLSRA